MLGRILALHSDFLSQTVVARNFNHFGTQLTQKGNGRLASAGPAPKYSCKRVNSLICQRRCARQRAHRICQKMEGLGAGERLRQHSACFETMVELLPTKYYVIQDDDSELEAISGKYWQNKKLKAPKEVFKAKSKKAKRMYLDPSSKKNLLDLQKEIAVQNGGDGNEVNGGKIHIDEDSVVEEARDHNPGYGKGFSVEKVKSGDLNELRERLRHKIGDFRRKRKVSDSEPAPEEMAQKRQKRIEKKQAKKDLKKKLKRKKQTRVESVEKKSDVTGEVVFSKFDFNTPTREWESAGKKTDYRKLLAKAEASQRRLEELKKMDEQKGMELQEKLKWQRALDLAGGTKLKDEPKLLKRTIKRLEKKKNKTQKQWKERVKHEQEMKDKRQTIKKSHVQERIDKIKAKKIKKKRAKRGKT